MSYPETVTNFLILQDGVDYVIAQHPNDRATEITAIQTFIGATGRSQAYSDSVLSLLKNARRGCLAEYKTAADIYVRAGEIMIRDATGKFSIRVNADDLTVDWGDLDTGSEAVSTRYYIYAVADASGTTFAVVLSASDAGPSGYTYYRLIGSFYNNAAGDITGMMNEGLASGFKIYHSGWFAFAVSTEYTLLHNLGTQVVIMKTYHATDASGTAMREAWTHGGQATPGQYGASGEGLSTTQVGIQVGSGGVGILDNNGTINYATTGYLDTMILALA